MISENPLHQGNRVQGGILIERSSQVLEINGFSQLLDRQAVGNHASASRLGSQHRIQAHTVAQRQVLQGGDVCIIAHIFSVRGINSMVSPGICSVPAM